MIENGKNVSKDSPGKSVRQPAPAPLPGATEVRTNDPLLAAPPSGPPPERAVTFQTGSLSEPADAYPFAGAGGVVQCEDKNAVQHDDPKREGQNERRATQQAKQERSGESNGKRRHSKDETDLRKKSHEDLGDDTGKDPDHGGEHKHRRHRKRHGSAPKTKQQLERVGRQMPRWPTLLITAVLALVCGVGGAWGYSALFGPDQSDQSDAKNKSSDQGGKSGKTSDKSGASGKPGGADPGGPDGGQTSEVADLKKNLADLDDGITQLTARLDHFTESMLESRLPIPEYYSGTSRIARMSPASAESPPILPNALPTQLNVLQRKVEQMSGLSARVQALEEIVAVLQEEIKTLAARRAAP